MGGGTTVREHKFLNIFDHVQLTKQRNLSPESKTLLSTFGPQHRSTRSTAWCWASGGWMSFDIRGLEITRISLEVDIDFFILGFLNCSCIHWDVSTSIDWLYLLSNRLGWNLRICSQPNFHKSSSNPPRMQEQILKRSTNPPQGSSGQITHTRYPDNLYLFHLSLIRLFHFLHNVHLRSVPHKLMWTAEQIRWSLKVIPVRWLRVRVWL